MTMINSYNNLPLHKYYKLKGIIESSMEDIDMQVNIIAIINDMTEDEVLNLTLSEYEKRVDTINFLEQAPTPKKLRTRKFIINNHKYNLMESPDKMTTGQYIDYQTYLKNNMGFEYILSCVLIPEGKKYGEYDVLDVINDILDLDIQSCLDVCFFFQVKWVNLMRNSLIYSDLMLMKLMRKVPKEKLEEMKIMRKQIHQKISEINGIGNTLLT